MRYALRLILVPAQGFGALVVSPTGELTERNVRPVAQTEIAQFDAAAEDVAAIMTRLATAAHTALRAEMEEHR